MWETEPGIEGQFGFCAEQKTRFICGFLLALAHPDGVLSSLDGGMERGTPGTLGGPQ